MPRKCCVPGCRSNYSSDEYCTVFRFPLNNPSLLHTWIRNIHRDNYVPNKDSVICMKHFEPRFIITEDRLKRSDGSEIVCQRKIPKLSDDAYPSIFNNLPKYLSKKVGFFIWT